MRMRRYLILHAVTTRSGRTVEVIYIKTLLGSIRNENIIFIFSSLIFFFLRKGVIEKKKTLELTLGIK